MQGDPSLPNLEVIFGCITEVYYTVNSLDELRAFYVNRLQLSSMVDQSVIPPLATIAIQVNRKQKT